MSSLNYSSSAKENEVCCPEKETPGLNIYVKEEEFTVKEEEFTVKEEDVEEAITVKEEQDVTVKEEDASILKEEEDVRVKEEEEAFRVKVEGDEQKEEGAVFVVKEEEEVTVTLKEEEQLFEMKEEGEITVTLEEEEEDETGALMNTRERLDFHSDSGKSPSGDPDPETPKPARRHHCSQCGKSFL
uniref:proline-, glutamic acid- and leucine-rich protein 1-like n=1 Tax=Oncorhynchus gorbuscha TaxID=8017 RepID=UPI001EAF1362